MPDIHPHTLATLLILSGVACLGWQIVAWLWGRLDDVGKTVLAVVALLLAALVLYFVR